MTLRPQTIAAETDKNSLSVTAGHSRPKVTVYVGQTLATSGVALNPLHKEGLNSVGRAISIPDFSKEINDEMIKAGAVKGHQYTIPLESTRNMAFTFDQFKLVAQWLTLGTDIAPVYNYASDGQTTVSSASKTGGTVASGTGVAKNGLFIVDTRHATYSGFLEATIIKTKSGTVVTWDPPLDHVPADTTTFKKVAPATTNISDSGLVYPDTVDIEYPRVYLVIDEFFPGNGHKFTRYFPEVEVLPGVQSSSGNMKTVSMTFRAIQQPEETFTLIDGTTRSTPFYGKGIWLPG